MRLSEILRKASGVAGAAETRFYLWRIRRRPLLARLRFAATARCPCGAGLAYDPAADEGGRGLGAWDCSDILLGRAIPTGQPGATQHTARLPFAFYEVKSEDQPSARGATTWPPK